MKWVLYIIALFLLLMGTIWILQGTGIYPVGFMAHQIKYTYAGLVVDVIAIGLFVYASRSRKNKPPSSNA